MKAVRVDAATAAWRAASKAAKAFVTQIAV